MRGLRAASVVALCRAFDAASGRGEVAMHAMPPADTTLGADEGAVSVMDQFFAHDPSEILTRAFDTGIVAPRQGKCSVVGFGDPSVPRRFSRVNRRGFFYSWPSGCGWGRAQWEAARPAGSLVPVRQPVVRPASLLARGLRVSLKPRRPAMRSTNTHIQNAADELDAVISRIEGACLVLELIRDTVPALHQDTDEAAMLAATVAAIRCFTASAFAQTDVLHQSAREVA